MKGGSLGLFEGYGIELEYMIADSATLDVLPVADEVLRTAAGRYTTDFQAGSVSWSNELALHVMEIKNTGPVPFLGGLAAPFQANITKINGILEKMGGRLMPSGMHPWMDPFKETQIWHRRNGRIYATYDRIFDCSNHGWSNIQSVHLNLPFDGDTEFGRLHAAVRLVMPLMPAVAASSPIVGGKISGLMDSRLHYYRINQRMIPVISGRIVPEAVFTRADYEDKILRKIYRAIERYDQQGVLAHDWLNSRGAIARFDRSTIEIRMLDVQECPLADLALAISLTAVIRAMVDEHWCRYEEQRGWQVRPLLKILDATIRLGERAVIDDPSSLRSFGVKTNPATALQVWKHLEREVLRHHPSFEGAIASAMGVILERGPLSRRILRATGKRPGLTRLKTIYGKLCDCLMKGAMFFA